MGLLHRAIRGAAAGASATAATTTVFGAAGASGLIHRQPPEKIVRTLFPSLPTTGKEALALASHFGYGMSGGALYASLVPARFQGTGTATLFGAMVWLAGYEGWLPAMDVLPPAHQDRPGGRERIRRTPRVRVDTRLGGAPVTGQEGTRRGGVAPAKPAHRLPTPY